MTFADVVKAHEKAVERRRLCFERERLPADTRFLYLLAAEALETWAGKDAGIDEAILYDEAWVFNDSPQGLARQDRLQWLKDRKAVGQWARVEAEYWRKQASFFGEKT